MVENGRERNLFLLRTDSFVDIAILFGVLHAAWSSISDGFQMNPNVQNEK
jgi:hypothetical protein